ncbi:MAG: GGDEF domain-containing protein [Lachnospiraceae bacterium]|nr:GGDEF domain-containing protein [Lachnospiraceae bacterium]
MIHKFFDRIHMEFFEYKWLEVYKRNKSAVQHENAVFTWNGIFFMLVVDLFLTVFFSLVKNGCLEARVFFFALPVIIITFVIARKIYTMKLPDHFLTVGITYIVGTMILCFCSYMIMEPQIQATFYAFFLVITLLTTLIVDVPIRKLAFLLLWDVMLVATALFGVIDRNRLLSILIHGTIVSLSSFMFGCFTSWRKLKGFDSERELLYISTHDRLTKLRNREKLYQDFDELVTNHQIIGLIIFDINSFKQLNDTYGHVFGDQAIQYVANLLQQSEEHYGIQFYRYGGDEFVGLVLPHGAHDPDRLIPHIKHRVAESQFCALDGTCFIIQVSGGYATYEPGYSLEKLVNQADEAMYIDKAQMKKEGLVSKGEYMK